MNIINLEYKKQVTPITICGDVVNVNQFISFTDTVSLIDETLNSSLINGVYHEVLTDAYFHYNIVKYFTDIELTDFNTEYDTLKNMKIIDVVMSALPKDIYDTLYDYLQCQKYSLEKYNSSLSANILGIMDKLPTAINNLNDMMNAFNPNDYQQVLDFATAANGGRNIFTNEEVKPEDDEETPAE